MKRPVLIVLVLLLVYFLFGDHIKVFFLNQIIISRGILVPNCFWYTVSQKLVKDGSGIDLFYKLKKKSSVPVTYMFGVKTYIITRQSDIKTILDNSPYPFGPGTLKYTFFKSFMKDNVGVSVGCPWKKRRLLNEKVLDTDSLHKFGDKFNRDTQTAININLIKNNGIRKIVYNDFVKMAQMMGSLIIFNTTDVPEGVFDIFKEANTTRAFYSDLSISKKTRDSYINYLKSQIANPRGESLVELCVENESSVYEIIQQIPHFIFPIVGLYLTTIPRLLLMFSNHSRVFQKVVDEINKQQENMGADEIYNLTYLRKCVLEILRLNNPVVTTFRTVLKDLKLGDNNFKKGSQLLILNNPILRTPSFFKEPDKYIPERWTKDMEQSYYAISFNQGPQMCPAKELAIYLVQCFMVNFIKQTGLTRDIRKLKTSKINTNKIGQVINTCNLEFTF